jgi:hypothetical protein
MAGDGVMNVLYLNRFNLYFLVILVDVEFGTGASPRTVLGILMSLSPFSYLSAYTTPRSHFFVTVLSQLNIP